MSTVVIDTSVVRRLLGAQFPGWADLPIRPVAIDGWDNRTFRLGSDLSVRLPSGPGYDLQVRKELEWLPRLQVGLTLPIPEVVALGRPDGSYPFEWTVRRWIAGTPVRDAPALDRDLVAEDLARFLLELRAVPAADGPTPGEHSQHRGSPLSRWHDDVEQALARLGTSIDRDRAAGLWLDALAADEERPARWLHGDVAVGNLLTGDGRLAAVIDFGCTAVGDPSCDLVLGWTYCAAASRARFRTAVGVGDAEWSRGAGWALWKALITVGDPRDGGMSRFTLEQLKVTGS